MKTTDFNSAPTADTLNESMFKKFGSRVNFSKYTREDLENYRNLLRTKLNQAESTSGFNDLLANESYQKDKFVLELLNTKIKEMLGESVLTEKSKSQKQARTMAAAAHDSKFAKKVGIKKEVAKEFNKADKGTKQLSKAMKNKPTKKDEKVKEEAEKKASTWTDKSGKKHPATQVKGKGYQGDKAEKEAKAKKPVKESTMRTHYRAILENLNRLINEDEEGKAKDITAGSDMVNDFTSWMQRIGQYQTKSMIELSDSIRANFGQAESDAFKNAIQPALQEALTSLTQARETITRAVAVLAGEDSQVTPMGDDGAAGGVGDLTTDMDTMNPPDEFSASDAAAGGLNSPGREMRESRLIVRATKLAEEHSIISKLAR